MNRLHLKFVSIVLAGILLPQAAQANTDIIDVPVNEFIHMGDTLETASNEVIVTLKEGQEIPSWLLDQKLEKDTYTTTVLESTNTLIVKSNTLNSTALIELFQSSLFDDYVENVTVSEENSPVNIEDINVTTNHAQNEIIVTLKEGMSIPQDMLDSMLKMGGEHQSSKYEHANALFIRSTSFSSETLLELFQSEDMAQYVKSASFNYEYRPEESNDPYYEKLWAIENTAQEVNTETGTVDADMDVVEAWEKTKGNHDVVVAVLDTGIDYTHTDLADNMWDGNAYHGYDFAADDSGNNDSDPMPDEPYDENGHYHGTHVAGTIGAVGDNSTGVSGIAQNVSIMAVKIFRPNGTGYSSDILEGLDYVLEQIDNGVNVVAINASYGGGGSQDDATNDAIKKLGDKGVVFCAAAGNDGKNIDNDPVYPASYDADNIIAIAASDQNDALASFSNYGVKTVDVAAPGTNILSTYPEDKYAYLNGTSMATPNVAGSIALIASMYPDSTVAERKAMILDHVDVKSTLQDKVATDGRININEALGTVEEEPINSAPDANADSATTAYNTEVTVDVVANDTDPEGDTLSVKSYTQPAHGTVTQTDSKLTYAPEDGFSGTDTFNYTVTDGALDDSTTVTITVDEKPNTAPDAKDDSATTAYNEAVTIDVLANDTDEENDELSLVSTTQPSHGTVEISNGKVIYTPEDNFSGIDTFTYTISDSNGAEDTATVNVTVEEEENTAPDAKDDSATTEYNTAVTIDVLANDIDEDTLSIQSVTQATHGTVNQVDGKVTYTPDNGFSGTDTFNYTATDGELEDTAQVTVTVKEAVNTAPKAEDDTAVTAYNTAVTVDVMSNDTDVDGDTLSIESYGQASHGTVSQVDGKLTYTPENGFSGIDTFTYTVTDGDLEDSATVTVTVNEEDAKNTAPNANSDSATTKYNSAVTINVVSNDTDAEGDTLSIKSYTQPSHGSVSQVDSQLEYTPVDGFSGTDTFTYTVTDGELEDSATVTVTVQEKEEDNTNDDIWYEFPEFEGFNFINTFMGNGVHAEITEGTDDETFVGKFTKDNITTLVTSYIPQTQALIYENTFAIIDMGEGNMQLKIDENARLMPSMPKIEDAIIPENSLPVGTRVEIPEASNVKFTFTMTENIKF